MRVLVVDDSKAMRMIIARELGRCGMAEEILEADSAVAAAQLLQDAYVDLILSDWNMPGESGLDFLGWLRGNGWAGHFGFVTSESGATTTRQALEAGAAFVVRKPFTSDDLSEAISRALGGQVTAVEEVPDVAVASEADAEVACSKVAAILQGTLRRTVAVALATGPPARGAARLVAHYVDVNGVESALCVVDAPLAAATGGALSMFSSEEAKSWASQGTLPKDLTDNYYEVANILAQLGGRDGERCLLSDLLVYAPGERLDDAQRVEAAPYHLDLQVEVEGYGSGTLSFVRF